MRQINQPDARVFLEGHLGRPVSHVEYVGEGAWSRCYGFEDRSRQLVVRFGRFIEDFEKDRWAATFRSPQLPVPEMLAVGQAFDGFFAISSRAHGQALEKLSSEAWQKVLPSLFAALDAMRTADLSATAGYGGWDRQGQAAHGSWREALLAVNVDLPSRRTHGWRKKPIEAPGGDAIFRAGLIRLAELADDEPGPRHLIHNDLLNRNVLVENGSLSALFDWGCSVYGDFVHDVALLEFWSPWFPPLEKVGILDRYREHCSAGGVEVPDLDSRVQACLIHIGLDHIAYHAHTGRFDELGGVSRRLESILS